DKYLLSELATKAATAGLVQLFSTLLDDTWPGFSGQALPKWATGAPLLVFSSCQFCELKQTVDKEIQVGSTKIEETEGILGSWKTKVKTKTEVQEHLWNWTATWRLYVTTPGSNQSFPLLSGSGGTTLKTMTTPPAKPQQPRPTAECAPTLELDMTWLARRLRAGAVDFTVNRTAPDCRTPARNKDMQAALSFFKKVHLLGDSAANILMGQLGTLLGGDTPGVAKPGEVFQPVLAMFALDGATAASRPVLAADMDVVLSAHRRSLLAHRESQNQHLGRIADGSDVSLNPSLISLLIVVQEMASLARQLTSAVRELERMLQEQLTAAIGKTLQPVDFGEYMEFHTGELLRPAYKPRPFVFAVRRAQHHPEGTVSIEVSQQNSHQAISSFGLHREAAPVMRMQLSSAATISFTGEHFVHAAVFHQFARQQKQDLRLVARARQLSCFVLVVGKIISSDTFKPAAALIIQNKDELVIPLLLETVPSPKEFLDSIQSLSPEQQRFAKAFRKMQLSSSLFAVAIVQIKPALEKVMSLVLGSQTLKFAAVIKRQWLLVRVASPSVQVLNLPEHSLTKEIQLTQDLIELFVRYQVAPDLMSYEPWSSGVAEKAARVTAADKLAAVKSHVKSLWETIAASKQKQLQEKQEEVKMRNMQSCGAEDCSINAGVSWTNYANDQEESWQELGGYEPPTTVQMKLSGSSGRMAKKAKIQEPVNYMSRSVTLEAASPKVMKAADAPSAEQQPPAQDAPSPPPPPPQAREAAEAADSGAFDYTQLPHQLDANYLKFDSDAVLRPTKIDLATVWTKQEQPGLLGDSRSRQLREADQRAETNKAFDLLDALSRSGAEALESSLHIVVAATHCFDETILNTLVQQNRNPIEKMERSMLIMASTLHRTPLDQLIHPGEVDRVRALMPTVFAGFAASKKLA
ncbi:TRPT1, partial [Symbiodinium necroappetens]